MTTTVLELQNITKRFGQLTANDDISLKLERGEILAFLGENGAGKTTLMNILFGHYVQDEGTVRVASGDGTMTTLPPGSPGAALASGNCSYGENTVTFAGACPKDNEADYSFVVSGAECMGTGTAVAKAIKAVPGVMAVTVDYETHMAYVCADGKKASKKAIEKSLKEAGYKEVKFVNAEKANCQKSHGKVEA